jgi:hypothetical protein
MPGLSAGAKGVKVLKFLPYSRHILYRKFAIKTGKKWPKTREKPRFDALSSLFRAVDGCFGLFSVSYLSQ